MSSAAPEGPQSTQAPLQPVPRLYPLRIKLDYRVINDASTGSGWTVYLASKSAQFDSDGSIPLNVLVQLSLPWPVLLENRISLKLHLTGRTTRITGNRVTIEILKYEFRICGTIRTLAAGSFS